MDVRFQVDLQRGLDEGRCRGLLDMGNPDWSSYKLQIFLWADTHIHHSKGVRALVPSPAFHQAGFGQRTHTSDLFRLSQHILLFLGVLNSWSSVPIWRWLNKDSVCTEGRKPVCARLWDVSALHKSWNRSMIKKRRGNWKKKIEILKSFSQKYFYLVFV